MPTTVLITGATSGIGRAAALHLASLGMRVIASGRKLDQLAALKAEADANPAVKGAGGSLHTVALEVTSAPSIAAAVDAIEALGGGVDVLVNNAGYGWAVPATEMSDKDLRGMFETNVFGLMAVTRAFVGPMIARGSGRILNISSVGGRVTFPLFGGYNATKYAVESLSNAMRMELAPLGIQVVLIEPGAIATNFSATSMQGVDAYKSENSPWAPIYAASAQLKETSDSSSAGTAVVSRAIARAITARRPMVRYVAPLSTRILPLLLENLPTFVGDYALSRMFGIQNARRPG